MNRNLEWKRNANTFVICFTNCNKSLLTLPSLLSFLYLPKKITNENRYYHFQVFYEFYYSYRWKHALADHIILTGLSVHILLTGLRIFIVETVGVGRIDRYVSTSRASITSFPISLGQLVCFCINDCPYSMYFTSMILRLLSFLNL